MEKLQDTLFGFSKEAEVYEILKEKFSDVVRLHRYNTYDFENESYLFELKSRNCFCHSFPTTMVGINKIRQAKHQMKPVIFLFLFVDGLYFWKLTEGEYLTESFTRTRDNKTEVSIYAYIPISKLQKFENFIP